ncbi:MAG: ribonuclease G [Gammaproteobacteria bacterium]|nr:ribonuclease G [Gammaproteobacteria bacterium]MCP4089180.1 ribonuclease G [Gammaproteobacteria bacterium]MCP4276796.1 ribonuclease G [Gammaproteobacteria bacterium]MCP4830639.1 ribonuclease G [Gammaproteobacteria bacterium]MCP4928448.1 ribonuclease G [Gammaproteobacteria bacterium]
MKAEILINVTSRELRAAVLEDGLLQDVFVERLVHTGLLGNIYKGRVIRVLPGMQAAFVDIGLERTAFLHVADIQTASVDIQKPDISKLLREGDELLVQIVKEPLGSKGARLSTFITIPSRYLVLLPNCPGVGISSRIEDEAERERLKSVAEQLLIDQPHGCIVRTAAKDCSVQMLQMDMQFVQKLWALVEQNAVAQSGIHKLHTDLPLAIRVIRDLVHQQVERVWVDSQDCLEVMLNFAYEFMPALADRIELYEGTGPIFDKYAVDEEINLALRPKVELNSGGYLIIEQTEAMTTIDVNTGAYTGQSNQGETILHTNLEAATLLARQLRLRNLGGIIIIDFIDMQAESHRLQVREALEAALAQDPARNQVSHVSSLGLVEMTRKRTRKSLEHILCDACPACDGRGHIKSPETLCYEIFRQVLRLHNQLPAGELAILAHDDVIERLLDEESDGLSDLEKQTGRSIQLQAHSMSAPDDFDVVAM